MSDIAKILNAEIRRLARREAKAMVAPLHKSLTQLRRQVRSLSQDCCALDRKLSQGAGQPSALPAADPKTVAKGRMSPRLIAKLRARLGLSLSDFALLLDVNSNSIFNWEHGKSRPKPSFCARIIAARQLGRREARRLLAAKSAGKQ